MNQRPAIDAEREVAGGHRGGDARIPVLYLAPWVDYGGSDKGTIDWFRWLDRDRFAPSLITTQPSRNRRIGEVWPFADEVWALPDLMAGHQFPGFIFDFIQTRGIRLLHIMNSRLGFDLLPDLSSLDSPPAVVVQLHVEEPDRAGYVRYVTTRYGNLVHGFSVSSRHLAEAVRGYDIPGSRVHVIPTGVDADGEFNPGRSVARVPKDPGQFRILFAGRLAEQKDPLLMLEVVHRLLATHPQVKVDVVGDGPLLPEVRRRVTELGLGTDVHFHPPTQDLASWLAASDLLLMTSVFEGVPYIVYEAMAMALPVVAPALPGNAELMEDRGGILVAPGASADRYADAVRQLIDDAPGRARAGQEGRERVLAHYTLREMAAGHERLYESVLPAPGPPRRVRQATRPEIRLATRPAGVRPLVSVVTPCFNHGRYLMSMLEGIEAQDYAPLEIIIVDDGSTDPETRDVLETLETGGRVQVIRQDRNRGPSAARNLGIDVARGRYLILVDADNILVPGAISALVEQVQRAGERVGFIYPALQYFGNRNDRFRPPAYNLHDLLHGNFADTCSLFDREVFDAGVRFAEDIQLGHEDWDLVLQLAARGVIGEPSADIIVRYRKQGFTRSDIVEYMRLPFWREIQERHPALFGPAEQTGGMGRFSGPGLDVKRRWNPAVSVVALEPLDFNRPEGLALREAMAAQSCRDFELVAECGQVPAMSTPVRRLPPGLVTGASERMQESVRLSRGRYLLATRSLLPLMSDPTVIERLLRGFWIDPELRAAILTDSGLPERYPFELLDTAPDPASVHSVAWPQDLASTLSRRPLIREGEELEVLARWLTHETPSVQWRHFPAGTELPTAPPGPWRALDLRPSVPNTIHREAAVQEAERRLGKAPAIPTVRSGQVRRWTGAPAWMPPETKLLARHRARDGSGYKITASRQPPDGYELDFDLGSIQQFSPPGTVRLIRRGGTFLTVPRTAEPGSDDVELGHLEEAPLPMFTGVMRARLEDGSETLVLSVERDHLRARAEALEFLGFIEAFPAEPVRLPGYSAQPVGPSLLQVIDRRHRRHVHLAAHGGAPESLPDRDIAELGCLHESPWPGSIAVWSDGRGHLWGGERAPGPTTADLATVGRWTAAPLNWRGFGRVQDRARAVARRGVDAARLLRGRDRGEPRLLGYAWPEGGARRQEVFIARHPVLEDTIAVHDPLGATDLGYIAVERLGFLDARAPITGTLGLPRAAVPWASRFGLARRG